MAGINSGGFFFTLGSFRQKPTSQSSGSQSQRGYWERVLPLEGRGTQRRVWTRDV